MTTPRSGRAVAVIVLAAAAVLVVGAASGAAATTWYVDDDGGAGINYMKIQNAVNAAIDGDTIIVYSGTYYENVDMDNQLIMRGVDTGEGKPVVDAEWDGSPIIVMVDGCMIDGFNPTGSEDNWEDAGIRVESSNNTITNNLINFNVGRGIILLGPSNNNTISTNDIDFNDDVGICLRDDCFDNRLIDNDVCFNRDHGIELDWDSFNTTLINNNVSFNSEIGICIHCDNNTLYDNTASNNEEGIYLDGVENCILRDNSINNNIYNFNVEGGGVHDIDTSNTINGKPIYYLIDQENIVIDSSWNAGYIGVVDSDGITVRDLTMTGNGQGILFYEVEDSRIEDVNAINNTCGICLIGSSDILLKNNNANSNTEYGLFVDWEYDNSIDTSNAVNGKPVYYFYDIHDQTISNLNTTHLTIAESSNIIIKDNNISEGDGMNLFDIEDSVISNNIASANFDGIRTKKSDNNIFTNNSANINRNIGIDIDKSNNNTIADNHADENEKYGIVLHGHSNNNTITNNYADANKKYGIRLSAGNSTVSGNHVAFNANAGIHVTGGSNHNKIINNNASFNDCGMHVWSSSNNNTIADNTISNNNGHGIFLYEADNNEFINNTISNNSGEGIYAWDSNYNSLISNDLYGCDASGWWYAGFIDLSGNGNILADNRVHDNYITSMDTRMYCIEVSGGDNSIVNNTVYNNTGSGVWNTVVHGIHVSGNKNILADNEIYGNDGMGSNPSVYGIYLSGGNNILTNNIIHTTNGTGLGLCEDSNYNNIYHNNFMNNNNHSSDDGNNNSWDMGPTVGGNYWSDHACTGNPSDGSQPYTIGGGVGAVDHYPFESMDG